MSRSRNTTPKEGQTQSHSRASSKPKPVTPGQTNGASGSSETPKAERFQMGTIKEGTQKFYKKDIVNGYQYWSPTTRKMSDEEFKKITDKVAGNIEAKDPEKEYEIPNSYIKYGTVKYNVRKFCITDFDNQTIKIHWHATETDVPPADTGDTGRTRLAHWNQLTSPPTAQKLREENEKLKKERKDKDEALKKKENVLEEKENMLKVKDEELGEKDRKNEELKVKLEKEIEDLRKANEDLKKENDELKQAKEDLQKLNGELKNLQVKQAE